MVRLEVANGKISISLKQDSIFPIYEEVGNGVAELLAELQAELVRMGNERENVDAAFDEMIATIARTNRGRVSAKLGGAPGGYAN